MRLWVILITMLLLVTVNALIYLEVAAGNPDELFDKIINGGSGEKRRDEKSPVELQECRVLIFRETTFQVRCQIITDPSERRNIYAATNFNHVWSFELAKGHSFSLDGEIYSNRIPKVFAVGIGPTDDFVEKHVIMTIYNDHVKSQVRKYLGRLIDAENDEMAALHLYRFYATTHYGRFVGFKSTARLLFCHYATAMKKLLTTVGYNRKTGAFDGSVSEPRSRSRSLLSRLGCSQSRSLSPSPSSQWFRSISQDLASWFSCERSKPKSSSSSDSDSGIEYASRPKFSIVPESPTRSQTKSPTRSTPKSLSKMEILQATNMLAFKMLDPCFVFKKAGVGLKEAAPHCATYCQFLGAAMQLYGQTISKGCEKLTNGTCVKRRCVCAQGLNTSARNVNMVECNNALRLFIYQQAR